MKFLLAIVILIFLLACNQSAENNTTTTAATRGNTIHVIEYLNNIALSTPGWDNNDMTRADMQNALTSNFAKHIQDSNLLDGVIFRLYNLEKNVYGTNVATFLSINLTQRDKRDNVLDSTRVNLKIVSSVPDSIAKSLKNGSAYLISAYTKKISDTSYGPGTLPIEQNLSHTIGMLDLGLHNINIEKIKAAN